MSTTVGNYQTVAQVGDFREGKIRRLSVDGTEIGVVNWQGQFYAFYNRCPHMGSPLNYGLIEDNTLYCPLHAAAFELGSGQRIGRGVAPEGLPFYAVRIMGDEVQVDLTRSSLDAE